MPMNKGKGRKSRKREKTEANDTKGELVYKIEGQEYAQVSKMLGNGLCEVVCMDKTMRLCHVRGKLHHKVWIVVGDIILVELQDYQDKKADVIAKYHPDEALKLKAYGELPENIRLNQGIARDMDNYEDGNNGNDYIEFEDGDYSDIDSI